MPERPILKLKLPKAKAVKPAPGADQPTNPGSGKKLKLKLGSKATPAAAAEEKSKSSSSKIVLKSSNKGKKKRDREEDGGANGGVPASASTIKRIKLTSKNTPKTPSTPFIRLKAKGKPPVKPQGIGYDSEASDAERDPHIEEEFVLRMQPGEDCDYVRNAIANKNWGPVSQGGADIKLKFLRHDGRRAVLIVRGKMYAASMVDLPCIVEGMKSWDKKGWYKTADICQIMLVLGPVKSEEEALAVPLPEGDVKKGTFMYEHGLTPPMKWVRKRRFRKRVSTNIVMQVEQEVEDLFRRDAEALGSDYKLQSWDEIEEEQRQQQMEDYFEDAEGEYDDDDPAVQYEGEMMMLPEGEEEEEKEEDGGDWEALMEEAEEEQGSQAATPAVAAAATSSSSMPVEAQPAAAAAAATTTGATAIIDATDEAETPPTTATGTHAAAAAEANGHHDDAPGATEGEEEEEDDDDDDDDADEDSGSDADEDDVDEDADEEELEIRRKKDEINDLKNAIAEKVAGLQKIGNAVLRNRQAAQIKSLQEDLERQMAAIGEVDEEDEE